MMEVIQSKKDIIETRHLISLGMDDDWSFELGFKFINETYEFF